jgi:vacuolar iron transporter family protein
VVNDKTSSESYEVTLTETRQLIQSSPLSAESLVREILYPYKMPTAAVDSMVDSLTASPSRQLEFLMQFHHHTEPPSCNRPLQSAITISTGYFLGGFVPLVPYFFASSVQEGLWWSVGVMVIALWVFGYVKTAVVRGWKGSKNAWAGFVGGVEMVGVGGLAAGCAMGLVRLFDSAT